ncbi:MAG: DUF4198 domain-containing protein [Desulfovibrio sp.]|nr:DUF4198 domain-containing protein [Desulfovibrio sp.]
MTFLQQIGHTAKPFLGGLALVAFLGAALPVAAHEFILKPDTATPAAGQKTRVQAQAAHVFMVSEEAENPANVRLQILQNNKATPVNLSEEAALAALVGDIVLSDNAPALLLGHRLPQIWSETTEGVLEGNRAQLEAQGKKVRSVGKYEKFAKTLLNPAANDSLYKTPQNQMLEILLLDNPASLKPGDPVNVQVLLRGKPLANAIVGLTHDGFSKKEDVYKVTATTDAQGKAALAVDKPALWMLRTAKDEKTSGTDADAHYLRATYVFPVR